MTKPNNAKRSITPGNWINWPLEFLPQQKTNRTKRGAYIKDWMSFLEHHPTAKHHRCSRGARKLLEEQNIQGTLSASDERQLKRLKRTILLTIPAADRAYQLLEKPTLNFRSVNNGKAPYPSLQKQTVPLQQTPISVINSMSFWQPRAKQAVDVQACTKTSLIESDGDSTLSHR